MKHLYRLILCAALLAAFSLPAAAIELMPETAGAVPSVYAAVRDGNIVYERGATAYSPSTFNKILMAYGLALTPEAVANVPMSYAKTSGDNIFFPNTSTAYEPAAYHSIFTAYGLVLSPEEVSAKLGAINYAKVVNDTIVFASGSTAYGPGELALILSTYYLPPPPTAVPAASAPVADEDKDGVADAQDKCPGTPAGASIDDRGCWVLSADYLFDFDKAAINSQYYPYLDDVVVVLNQNSTLRLEVQGHTDSVGPNDYNQGLSERRAQAVHAYFVDKGIPSSRVTSVGFGEERPTASNDTDEGRAKNRRVELDPNW
jgi:outer membrane protein OmpA-like peptidoglycan-associated protein